MSTEKSISFEKVWEVKGIIVESSPLGDRDWSIELSILRSILLEEVCELKGTITMTKIGTFVKWMSGCYGQEISWRNTTSDVTDGPDCKRIKYWCGDCEDERKGFGVGVFELRVFF